MNRKTVANICNILGWIVIVLFIISGIIGFFSLWVLGAKTYGGGRGFMTGLLFLICEVIIGIVLSVGLFALSGVVSALDDQLSVQQEMFRTLLDIKRNTDSAITEDKLRNALISYSEPASGEKGINAVQTPVPDDNAWICKVCGKINQKNIFICSCGNKKSQNEDIEETKQDDSKPDQLPVDESAEVKQEETKSEETNLEETKTEETKTEPEKPAEASEMDTTVLTSDLLFFGLDPSDTEKPDDKWICPVCGKENLIGDYCIECGNKKINV